MTRINSYPKVYNLGHAAIDDLLLDDVVVEEKIDGSQFSFGLLDGELKCKSKGATIHHEAPEGMFAKAVETVKTLELHPGWIYRAEYLQKPKHNTLVYDRVPKGYLIIFDISPSLEAYLSYDEKAQEVARLGLECVPRLTEGRLTDLATFKALLETPSILGGQKVEGVVIKNYHRFGPDGKALMGKHVSEEFKEVHRKSWKQGHPGGKDIIQRIADGLRTPARWEKAVQHMRERGELTDSPKDIGPLIKGVNLDVLEECGDEIKEQLFKWCWKDISRRIIRGLPEWYKEKLAAKQFGETTDA